MTAKIGGPVPSQGRENCPLHLLSSGQPAFLPVANFRGMLKLMSTESVTLANPITQCRPFLLLSLIFPGTRKISWKTHSQFWEPYWRKTNQSYWPINLTWPWEICVQVKKQQLEPDIENQAGSKSGKEIVKAAYCHPAYLTYMQSISCEIPGWMKHGLQSRLPGETSMTSDMQITL